MFLQTFWCHIPDYTVSQESRHRRNIYCHENVKSNNISNIGLLRCTCTVTHPVTNSSLPTNGTNIICSTDMNGYNTVLNIICSIDMNGYNTVPNIICSTDMNGYNTVPNIICSIDMNGYNTVPNIICSIDMNGYNTVPNIICSIDMNGYNTVPTSSQQTNLKQI